MNTLEKVKHKLEDFHLLKIPLTSLIPDWRERMINANDHKLREIFKKVDTYDVSVYRYPKSEVIGNTLYVSSGISYRDIIAGDIKIPKFSINEVGFTITQNEYSLLFDNILDSDIYGYKPTDIESYKKGIIRNVGFGTFNKPFLRGLLYPSTSNKLKELFNSLAETYDITIGSFTEIGHEVKGDSLFIYYRVIVSRIGDIKDCKLEVTGIMVEVDREIFAEMANIYIKNKIS